MSANRYSTQRRRARTALRDHEGETATRDMLLGTIGQRPRRAPQIPDACKVLPLKPPTMRLSLCVACATDDEPRETPSTTTRDIPTGDADECVTVALCAEHAAEVDREAN